MPADTSAPTSAPTPMSTSTPNPEPMPLPDDVHGWTRDTPLVTHSIDGQRAILGRLVHVDTGQFLLAHRHSSGFASDRAAFPKPVDRYDVCTLDGHVFASLYLYRYGAPSKTPPRPPAGFRYHFGPLPELPEPRVVGGRLSDFPAEHPAFAGA